jgi:hypothetical protein
MCFSRTYSRLGPTVDQRTLIRSRTAHSKHDDRVRMQIIFIFIFWWVSAFVLLAVAAISVYWAGQISRLWPWADLRFRLAISAAHMTYVILLTACVFLYLFMKSGHVVTAAGDTKLLRICLILTNVWIWCYTICEAYVYLGQADRERRREVLMQQGRTWTSVTDFGRVATESGARDEMDALTQEQLMEMVRIIPQYSQRKAK